MIINMATIARRKMQYLGRTLESLFQSDGRDIPVNFILGSFDTSHIEQYRKVANIVRWDQESQWRSREGNPRHNYNVNAIRSLRYGDDEYCLCCEDDILFGKYWYSDLMQTVAEIDHKNYVLSLGQDGGDSSPGKRYATHIYDYLCGSQAIFYPSKSVRSAVAEYVDRNIRRATVDQLIGRYAKQYALLYNTVPVLVSH